MSNKPTQIEAVQLAYWKAVLSPGCLFSLPKDCFHPVETHRPIDAKQVVAAIQNVFPDVHVSDNFVEHMFFEVISSTPHLRVTAVSSAGHATMWHIAVRQYALVQLDAASNSVVLGPSDHDSLFLNLKPWRVGSVFERVLRSIVRWRGVQAIPQLSFVSRKVSKPVEKKARITYTATNQLLQPVFSDTDASDEQGLMALLAPLEPADLENALSLVMLHRKEESSDWLHHMFLQSVGCRPDALEQLVAHGVLYTRNTEEGSMYAISFENVRWTARRVISVPVLVVNADRGVVSIAQLSKLECCRSLLAEGLLPQWQGLVPPLHTGTGAERKFAVSNMTRSQAYWQACVSLGQLACRGVTELLHHMPQEYYICLMYLPQDKLMKLLSHPALPDLKSADFRKALADLKLPIAARRVCDAIDEGDVSGAGGTHRSGNTGCCDEVLGGGRCHFGAEAQSVSSQHWRLACGFLGTFRFLQRQEHGTTSLR